ncbi:MAG: serine/threonine protein kinase [Planctomycetes bacterium]|nr:serine/threonine protein kinase [Planctomycetota bacterium]
MAEERQNLHFGAIAIKLGFTTLERVDECVRLQERMKQMGVAPQKLGQIMVAKGYLSEEQVREIFKAQGIQGGHTHIVGYKILGKIGQGAMGSIYKALQISMDRVVAIKVLAARYAQNEQFRERFLREARAVARLNHPNIIQGYDVGESNGVHYFAMEYVDGPTIGELLKRGGALDEKRALDIVVQISRALNHAYQNGIIHRDIKPDNIIRTRDGVAKLCDLGLAKIASDGLSEAPAGTRPGASMGTPYYISPEQARGEPDVDTRSDLYSLGASFYHMVVGDVPFPAETAAVVISKHLTEPLTPPRQRNALVSPAMDYVICKMMEKAREDRYQTPGELLRDLETVATGGVPDGFQRQIEARSATAPKLRRSRFLRPGRRFRRR